MLRRPAIVKKGRRRVLLTMRKATVPESMIPGAARHATRVIVTRTSIVRVAAGSAALLNSARAPSATATREAVLLTPTVLAERRAGLKGGGGWPKRTRGLSPVEINLRHPPGG